jgi:hypothetical protein
MTDRAYFEELARALRAAGVPADRAEATVGDLIGYLAETGATALEEFGPVEEFAARLTGGGPGVGAGEGPGEGEEVWKWTTDIYADRRLLNEYGAQGWEVERVDRLGMFVSRRVPGAAMRWEYRREMTNNKRERADIGWELAPDGWEPCGEWMFMTYFKRPLAATAGPAAALAAPPEQPKKRVFLTRRHYALLILWLVTIALVVTYLSFEGAAVARTAFLVTALLGAVIGAGLGLRGVRRDVRDGVER